MQSTAAQWCLSRDNPALGSISAQTMVPRPLRKVSKKKVASSAPALTATYLEQAAAALAPIAPVLSARYSRCAEQVVSLQIFLKI